MRNDENYKIAKDWTEYGGTTLIKEWIMGIFNKFFKVTEREINLKVERERGINTEREKLRDQNIEDFWYFC